MDNSSEITFFILAVYEGVGNMRYFYFSILLVLNVTIILANVLLIVVIFVDRSLHEPMYVFLCNLFVNELYGSTALLPGVLLNLLSDTHEVSSACCFLQIFCVYTYASIELCNLAAMAYDRYLSICHPLHYSNIMTACKVYTLIVFIWVYSFVKFSINLSLTLQVPLCGNIIYKVGCDNFSLIKLGCTTSMLNNIYELCGTVVTIAVPLIPILYSYAKIIRICYKSSKEAQKKALNTCTPHLISLMNFSFCSFFEIVQNRFDLTYVPSVMRITLSVYFLICTPLFNPIMYGVKITKIRKAVHKMLFAKTIFPQFEFAK
ncbi:olfactory receptor 10A6-like [Megalops cyprinoides]|uniref:olfactory receptor 10A6-like n=1 Tax=Megalops cyprinoides TaxID=118141 RepID=UPI001864D70F|nr:olfactory receptor 10A6-like [Megalops cyprinoides]